MEVRWLPKVGCYPDGAVIRDGSRRGADSPAERIIFETELFS